MEFSHRRIDVSNCYASGTDPYDLIPRDKAERWYVPSGQIVLGQPVNWTECVKGEHVVVPLIPYLVQPHAELAMAFGVQLAIACLQDFPTPAKKLHISVGSPGQIVGEGTDACWRLHLGLAVHF